MIDTAGVTRVAYFKRYKMEVGLAGLPPPEVPPGFTWVAWHPSLLEAHADVLYESFHRISLPRILRNFDAYSMGHGVEIRMPFLDWKVVCYAFSTPDESKVGNGLSKNLLREAMRGVVPEPLRLRRDKLGFTAPVNDWLRAGLGDWLWAEMNDSEFLRSDLWDGPGLRALAAAKRSSGAPWTRAEAERATLAVTAHWWRTRWLRGST